MKIQLYFAILLLLNLSNSSLFGQSILEKFYNVFSNGSTSTDYMQKAPNIGIEGVVSLKISELLYADKYFKFHNELKQGNFIIEYGKEEVVFKIISLNYIRSNRLGNLQNNNASQSIPSKNVLVSMKFEIIKHEDAYSLKLKDEGKYFDEKALLESFNLSSVSSSYLNHIFKDRILIDKEICNFSLYHYSYPNLGKILNKSLIAQRTIDNNGNAGKLFRDATAGVMIPIPIGAGSPKLLVVDKIADCITMMDRDIVNGSGTLAYSYPQYPGFYYSLNFPTDITQGARRVKVYGEYLDSIVSLYITDQGNDRIIRLDYVMQYRDLGNGYLYNKSEIYDATFRTLINNCRQPYSLAIHKGDSTTDSTDDVLWYSEGYAGNKSLVCVNAITGDSLQRVRNLRSEPINPSRLSIYRSPDGLKNLLVFIDEESNKLGVLKLESNGTFINSNINIRYFQNFGNVKLKSVLLASSNTELDKTTIWTVGNMVGEVCNGGEYCGVVSTLKINYINNFPASVEYLASSRQGNNSTNSFVNLQNLYAEKGYLDIATMEKWSDNFGLRRFKPGIDTIACSATEFCRENNNMYLTLRTTNPCKIKFESGEYGNGIGPWTSVPGTEIFGLINYNNDSFFLPSGTSILRVNVPIPPNIGDMTNILIRIRYTMVPQDESIQTSNNKITKASIVHLINCNGGGGGCPYVFVNNENGFVQDNNILHRSEFEPNQGVDIEDKYLLKIQPSFNPADSTCQLRIKELNNDISNFDKFKLIAIDHPSETQLGISENQDFILYFPFLVNDMEYAELNGNDVTNVLYFDTNYAKKLQGGNGDLIIGTFPTFGGNVMNKSIKQTLSNDINRMKALLKSKIIGISKVRNNTTIRDNLIFDSTVIFMDPSSDAVITTSKRPAGHIVAFDSENEYVSPETEFARRENSTSVFVPVGQNISVDSIVAAWSSNFMISYLVVMPVFYGGYIENNLDLVEATDSLNGDVLSNLIEIDQGYATMDSTTHITLKFKNTFGEVQSGFIRDYVLVTNGRYENAREGDNLLLNENQNLSLPKQYKLYQNYPNPFNPSTTIKFDIPKPGQVNIRIYDVLGKEVYSLTETKHAGSYQVNFNGSNISSGIYFCKFVSGDFTAVKRMVLIK